MSASWKFSDHTISRIIRILRILYLVLVWLACIELFLLLMGVFFVDHSILYEMAGYVLMVIVLFAYYFVLRSPKSWVPAIITYLSAILLLYGVILALAMPPSGLQILAVILRLLAWLVEAFQIYFFSKKEVRAYYKATKATTLF